MKHFRAKGGGQPTDGFINAPVRRDSLNQPTAQPIDAVRFGGKTARRTDDFDRPDGYHPSNPDASFAASRTVGSAGDFRTSSMLNMTIPKETGRVRPRQPAGKKIPKRRNLRKWIRRSTAAVVVCCVVVGGFVFSKGYIKLHGVFRGTNKTSVALQSNVNPDMLHSEGDARINVLLLGIGGDGHDGPDLTDTILLASIDPVNHKAALLSVPRDLWVSVPHHGSMKINAAYETGKYAYLHKQSASNANAKAVQAGFDSTNQIVGQVLGLHIDYDVLVNFKAFQQAVDTVGGVTVDVPATLYDPTMAWENGGNPVLAKAGIQTFNGTRALMYVRSRETTSDFARAQRQRAVLVALGQKALSLGTLSNPLKISQLLDTFGNNVVSSLSLSDTSRLYSIVKAIPSPGIQSIGLDDPPNNYVVTGHIGTQSIVKPRAGLNNYAAIQTYVHSQLPDGYIIKENAQVAVLSGVSQTAAEAQAAVLKSFGYNVATVGTTAGSYQHAVVVDLSHGKDPYTAHYLSQRYKVTPTTKLPGGVTAGTAQFVIILGKDQS